MKLCLSQCCSIYLYIDNVRAVRARKSLPGKWRSKKFRETPGFSRSGAADFLFAIFLLRFKIAASKWCAFLPVFAPRFSRGSAAEICFWIFAESLKIYGIVRALVI